MTQHQKVIDSRALGQRIVFVGPTEAPSGPARLDVMQAPRRGVPPHVHPRQEEEINVIEGEIDLLLGWHRKRLSAGQSALVPPGTAHGFYGRRPAGARLMNELRPALSVEDAFVETFAVERSPRPPLGRLLQLALVADRHPDEFPLYLPLVPWSLQRATMRVLARIAGRLGVPPPVEG